MHDLFMLIETRISFNSQKIVKFLFNEYRTDFIMDGSKSLSGGFRLEIER